MIQPRPELKGDTNHHLALMVEAMKAVIVKYEDNIKAIIKFNSRNKKK